MKRRASNCNKAMDCPCMKIHVCIYLRVYTYRYTHVYIYTHICMCIVYIYIYMYIHVHTSTVTYIFTYTYQKNILFFGYCRNEGKGLRVDPLDEALGIDRTYHERLPWQERKTTLSRTPKEFSRQNATTFEEDFNSNGSQGSESLEPCDWGQT